MEGMLFLAVTILLLGIEFVIKQKKRGYVFIYPLFVYFGLRSIATDGLMICTTGCGLLQRRRNETSGSIEKKKAGLIASSASFFLNQRSPFSPLPLYTWISLHIRHL